jgi:hypothetical protein
MFKSPQPAEAAILASMIEAAGETSLAFTIEIQLTSRIADEPPPEAALGTEGADQERRDAVRVPVGFPVRLETMQYEEPAVRLPAKTLNISRDGICLVVKASPDQVQGRAVVHFAPLRTAGQPRPHEPGTPDSALPAQVVWAVADPTAPEHLRPEQSLPATRVGLRFSPLTPFTEREVTRLLRQQIASLPLMLPSEGKTALASLHRECRNQRGLSISTITYPSPRKLMLPF